MRLETERLILRVPDERDVDPWAAMHVDPAVTEFLGARSREEIVEHINIVRERHTVDGFGLLAVERKDDGRVIGRSGLLVWDVRTWTPTTLRDAGANAEVEIGWALAPAFWGLGYATEAGAACREYVLGELARPRVIALIDPENQRSIGVAERLGLTYEQDILQRGTRPVRLYALDARRYSGA